MSLDRSKPAKTQYANQIGFVGARKGANGSLDELKASPPKPKAWLIPELSEQVMQRLEANQSSHSRLNLHTILHNHLYDSAKQRYRLVWSKNMITAAGVSSIPQKGANSELVLHFRDGEEEKKGDRRWMRQVLESLYKKQGRVKEAVEDFVYLTLVHEASEIHQRKTVETLVPDIKAEIRAEIEEAKAYFSLPAERRTLLKQLYKLLDETDDPRLKLFSAELELFETIGEDNLGSIKGLLVMIDFVVSTPDYAREANLYHDERTRLQLARSLFVDILHDFAGSSRADKWVREVENQEPFGDQPVSFMATDNSARLSEAAEDVLKSAARILETLQLGDVEPNTVPSKKQRKRVIGNFNKKVAELDELKSRLKLNEVINIPDQLRESLENNELNRFFSYMDDYGIYHSLNLSRLDLRGLNLHSGIDERTTKDKDRNINQHKDGRSDLRGAHIVGSDVSERADFSGAQLDFAIAAFSDFSEVVFTRAKAIGMVLYGANANEGQFESAKMTALDARGMSASFARLQMSETDINGMKVWQCDVPNWQRAYVDISRNKIEMQQEKDASSERDTLKAELDFLDDSFLDELEEIESTDGFQGDEKWIELRELEGQLEFLKGRGVVFYSRNEKLEYSGATESAVEIESAQAKSA